MDQPDILFPPSAVECKPGDWVILKTGVDHDLSAQIGIIEKLDSGIVNVSIERFGLGVQFELQQEHLSHASDDRVPDSLKRARLACGGYDLGLLPRDSKRHQPSDGSSHPPAHLPPLFGRGAEVRKEVLRAVRRELLSMEENIGWEKVDKTWKSRRAPWIKGLRAISGVLSDPSQPYNPLEPQPPTAPPELEASSCSEVSLLAGAMADLHEALKTDKNLGFFKRGGSWEIRLCELASEGGSNYQALQIVWEEMRHGVMLWLEGVPILDDEDQGRAANNGDNENGQQGSLPSGLSQETMDKLGTAASCRAIAALYSAALQGMEYVDQVPLDKIIGPSREGLAVVRALVEQERDEIKRTGKVKEIRVVEPPLSDQPVKASEVAATDDNLQPLGDEAKQEDDEETDLE